MWQDPFKRRVSLRGVLGVSAHGQSCRGRYPGSFFKPHKITVTRITMIVNPNPPNSPNATYNYLKPEQWPNAMQHCHHLITIVLHDSDATTPNQPWPLNPINPTLLPAYPWRAYTLTTSRRNRNFKCKDSIKKNPQPGERYGLQLGVCGFS